MRAEREENMTAGEHAEWERRAEGSNSELIDLLSCESVKRAIEYILNEAQSCPEDSLVDIANDAFSEYNLPLKCDAMFKITEAT